MTLFNDVPCKCYIKVLVYDDGGTRIDAVRGTADRAGTWGEGKLSFRRGT